MRSIIILLTLSSLLLSGCIGSIDKSRLTENVSNPSEFIIVNATVFDGFKFNDDTDVWVRDGKIVATGSNIETPSSTTIIEASGSTLIPGLIDMHVHLLSAGSAPWRTTMGDMGRTLSANLSLGITTVLDMGAPLGDISSWENDTEQAVPRYAFAGTMFNLEGGHPAPMIDESAPWPLSILIKMLMITEIHNQEDIVEAIAEHKKKNASFIKIAVDEIPLDTPKMGVDLISEIVLAAHKSNLKVAAHIGSEEDMLRGIEAGVDIFVHGVYRSTFSDAALNKLKASQIPVAPTTIVFEQLARFYEGDTLFSALETKVADPDVLAAYQNRPNELEVGEQIDAWFKQLTAHRQTKFDTLRAMHKAGIPLFMGSDSPNVNTVGGAALHQEMALWQQHAGLSPEDILSAATGRSGQWLEDYLGWKIGQIKPGYEADLVLIGQELKETVSNSRYIDRIWMGGREVSPVLN